MEKNKVQTYLLYAIGEIALVMIGILLALQVNNWNEDRKQNLERIALIESMKSDYENALESIRDQISEAEARGIKFKQLLAYSAGDEITISDDSLKVMLQESMLFFFSRNFSNTYEQAKSSGKLSLIKNTDLLRALSENEENIEGLLESEKLNPVFDQFFKDFNAKVEFMSVFDRMGGFNWLPKPHPDIYLEGQDLHQFLRSPDTYTYVNQVYFANNVLLIWWESIGESTVRVLEEIEISLNN